MSRLPVVRTAVAALAASALLALAPTPALAVTGGATATKGQFPWTVAVVVSGQSVASGQICGGTLIAPDRVLTAAHCIIDPETLVQSHPGDLDVVVGLTNKYDLTGSTRIGVNAISLHRSADVRHFRYDAAQLVLANPVPSPLAPAIVAPVSPAGVGTADVPAAPRTNSSTADAWGPGTNYWIFGWGSTSSGGLPQATMRYAPGWGSQAGRLDDTKCATAHGSDFNPEDMLCAGALDLSTPAPDTCQGDSGGPLLKMARAVDSGNVPKYPDGSPQELERLETEKAAYRTALRNSTDNRALLLQWTKDATTSPQRTGWRDAERVVWRAELRDAHAGEVAGWHASELGLWRAQLRDEDPARVASWRADERAQLKQELRAELATDIPLWENDELDLWRSELRAEHADDIAAWEADEIQQWKDDLISSEGPAVVDGWKDSELADWLQELRDESSDEIADWRADEILQWKDDLIASLGPAAIQAWRDHELALWKNELKAADPGRVTGWRADELAEWREELRLAHSGDIPGWRLDEIARWKQEIRDTRPGDVTSWRNGELNLWIDQLLADADPQDVQDWRDAELAAWVAEYRTILPTAALDAWRADERDLWLQELRDAYEGELVEPELTDFLIAEIDSDPVARDARLETRVDTELLAIIDYNPAARDLRLDAAVREQLVAIIDADPAARDLRLDAAVDLQVTAVVNSDPVARDARLDAAVENELTTLINTATAPTRSERLDARVDAELEALIDAATDPTRAKRLGDRVETELKAIIDADPAARDARLEARVTAELTAIIDADVAARESRLSGRVDRELEALIDAAAAPTRAERLAARVSTEIESLIEADPDARAQRLADRVDGELGALVDADPQARDERLDQRVADEVEALIDADPEARDARLEARVSAEIEALLNADPDRDDRLADAVDAAVAGLLDATSEAQPVDPAATDADRATQQALQARLVAASATEITKRETERDAAQQASYMVNGHHWRLMGIASWGVGCGSADKPGVYTRVGAPSIYDYVTTQNPAPMPKLARPSALPIITGKFQHGGTISCTPGTWNNASTYTFEMWKDYNTDGVKGGNEPLIAHTDGVHAVTATDLAGPYPVGCTVSARGPGGYAVQSAPTFTDLQVILPPPNDNNRPPASDPPAAGADTTKPLLARNSVSCGTTSCKVSVIGVDRGAGASGVKSVTGTLTIKRHSTCRVTKGKDKGKKRSCTKTTKKTYKAKVSDDVWRITISKLRRTDKLTLRFTAVDRAGNKSSTLRVPIKLKTKQAAKKKASKKRTARAQAPQKAPTRR